MPLETLGRALALADSGSTPLHIQFTGGEATLVPELVEAAAQRIEALTRPCTTGIQTNATSLDVRMLALMQRYKLQVGVSLDGPPAVHEALRGQAAATLRGMQLLESHGIPFRVTTVVSDQNVASLDKLAWVLAGFHQARGIGLDLLVKKGRAMTTPTPAQATRQALVQGVKAMLAALKAINRQRHVPLQLREREIVRRMLRTDPDTQKSSRDFCYARRGESLAVSPDGQLFPCGQTLGDAKYSAGHIEQPAKIKNFPGPSLGAIRGDCAGCPLQYRCPDDCPSRLSYNREGDPLLACELYRTLAADCLGDDPAYPLDSTEPSLFSRSTPCRR